MTRLPPAREEDLRGEVFLSIMYWNRECKGLGKKLTDAFGENWNCTADPLTIYPYLHRLEGVDSDYIGQAIERIFENIVYFLIERANEDSDFKTQMNTLFAAHHILLDIDAEEKTNGSGYEISDDGNLTILISDGKLAEDPLNDLVLNDAMLQEAFETAKCLTQRHPN